MILTCVDEVLERAERQDPLMSALLVSPHRRATSLAVLDVAEPEHRARNVQLAPAAVWASASIVLSATLFVIETQSTCEPIGLLSHVVSAVVSGSAPQHSDELGRLNALLALGSSDGIVRRRAAGAAADLALAHDVWAAVGDGTTSAATTVEAALDDAVGRARRHARRYLLLTAGDDVPSATLASLRLVRLALLAASVDKARS